MLALDRLNLDHRDLLTMSLAAGISLAAFLFKNYDFLVLLGLKYCSGHFGPFDVWCAEFCLVPVMDHEDFFNINGGSDLGISELIGFEDVSFFHRKLAALGLYRSFHEGGIGKSCIYFLQVFSQKFITPLIFLAKTPPAHL